MKFVLISTHLGGVDVPENEKESHMKAFGEWLQTLNASVALPLSGGATVTAREVSEHRGGVAGVLMFEAASLAEAVEKAKRSPGLRYGWTHDVLEAAALPVTARTTR